MRLLCAGAALALAPSDTVAAGRNVSDAITFAVDPGHAWLPLEEAAAALRLSIERDEKNRRLRIEGVDFPAAALRVIADHVELVSTGDLQRAGCMVTADAGGGGWTVSRERREIHLMAGAKRAEVDLAAQRLNAWQGGRLVMHCRVSSGRRGRTPAGNFAAGPYKARMHYSKRYDNAPMPWSVQINGHVFIHGFSSVPDYPASHGCIRLPLSEGNPAKLFYEWIDIGTPVRVLPQ